MEERTNERTNEQKDVSVSKEEKRLEGPRRMGEGGGTSAKQANRIGESSRVKRARVRASKTVTIAFGGTCAREGAAAAAASDAEEGSQWHFVN